MLRLAQGAIAFALSAQCQVSLPQGLPSSSLSLIWTPPCDKRFERFLLSDQFPSQRYSGKCSVTILRPQSAGFRLGISEECLEPLHLAPGFDGPHQVLPSFVAHSDLPGAFLLLCPESALLIPLTPADLGLPFTFFNQARDLNRRIRQLSDDAAKLARQFLVARFPPLPLPVGNAVWAAWMKRRFFGISLFGSVVFKPAVHLGC